MPNNIIQAQIAFKNLLGKAQVNENATVINEIDGYLLTVSSDNVWMSKLPPNPTTAVNNQLAVPIVADLKKIQSSFFNSRFLSYEAVWGATPSGKDPKTNQDYKYGVGSLKNVSIGDRILQIIPSSYGSKYEIIPYNGTAHPDNEIPIFDARDWVFQYNAGIFYQSNLNFSPYTEPKCLSGYYYLGDKLSTFDSTAPEIIRVTSASGPVDGVYFATESNPFISTYSINHLYLVDFIAGNTTSSQLSINYLPTYSIYKWGQTGLGNLTSGDIIGATGSTAGQLYYMTWNPDGYFEFFSSKPTQTPGVYKKEIQVTNPVGGIGQRYSFNDVSLQSMFDNLIYPELQGNFTELSLRHPRLATTSMTDISLIDIGRTLSGVLTYSWNYVSGPSFNPAVYLDDVTPNGIFGSLAWPPSRNNSIVYNITSMQGTFSYTSSVVATKPDKRIFNLTGVRTNNTSIRRQHEIIWTWRGYYGTTTSVTVSGFGVNSFSSSLMTQSSGSLIIGGPTGGFKYMAFPDLPEYNFRSITYFGLPVTLATNSYPLTDNFGNNYAVITVTNSYNQARTYRIYRTLNQISGTFTVNLNN